MSYLPFSLQGNNHRYKLFIHGFVLDIFPTSALNEDCLSNAFEWTATALRQGPNSVFSFQQQELTKKTDSITQHNGGGGIYAVVKDWFKSMLNLS